MNLSATWRFLPLWVISWVLGLAGAWLPYYLRATGERVSTNPFENGTFYVFSFVLVFTAFGSLLNDLLDMPGYGLRSTEAIVSFGVAAVVALLGGTKYGAILVREGSEHTANSGWFSPLLLMTMASGYGFICEYLRNGLRRIQRP